MSEFKWKLLSDLSLNVVPNIVEANLNGYSRRYAYGLNNAPEEWTGLRFYEDLDNLMAFLKLKGAVTAFTWTSPNNEEIKVICKKWGKDFVPGGAVFVRATFNQVFE